MTNDEISVPDFLKGSIEKLNLEINFKTKPENLPLFIAKTAITKAVRPNIRHLKACGCGNNWLLHFKQRAIDYNVKLYEDRNLSERDPDGRVFKTYMDSAINADSWEMLEKYLKSIDYQCPVEQKMILEFLLQYSGKYNLGDADVWNIVEPLLNFKLAVDRYALYANNVDFVSEVMDRNDNLVVTINPVEDLKLKYDKERVSAVEKLNRMIEGNKNLNINVDVKRVVFDRDKMYGEEEIE